MIILSLALLVLGLYTTYLWRKQRYEEIAIGHLLHDLHAHGNHLRDTAKALDALAFKTDDDFVATGMVVQSCRIDEEADFILDFVLSGYAPEEYNK